MDAYTQSQCEGAAARVAGVGLDPVLIIKIITTVLPLLVGCFQREDEPDPVRARAALVKAHRKNPDKLRRRIRVQVQRQSPETIDKGQAFAIADGIITQAMAMESGNVARVFEPSRQRGSM